MFESKPVRHFLLLSSLYLLSGPVLAQQADQSGQQPSRNKTALQGPASQKSSAAQPNQPASQQRGHQPTLQAKADFIADFDTNGDGKVSQAEFFSVRQQRLAAMDIHHNAQIDAAGYQAEYADRLDQRLAADRAAQIKQTEVRFNAVDSNKDGRISLAEYQASGARAFAFIDQNQDGVISPADPAPAQRGRGATSQRDEQKATQRDEQKLPQRRPALMMPTTHSVSGMLAMYDLDGDGQVTLAEYQQSRGEAFARTDSDQSGDLSAQEYMAEFTDRLDQQIAKTREAQLKQALVRFKALDKDENGILSAKEFHNSGQQMFARWDTDQNREVSASEPLPKQQPERRRSTTAKAAAAPAAAEQSAPASAVTASMAALSNR